MKIKNFIVILFIFFIIITINSITNALETEKMVKYEHLSKETNDYFSISYPSGYDGTTYSSEARVFYSFGAEDPNDENRIKVYGNLQDRRAYDPKNVLTNDETLKNYEDKRASVVTDDYSKEEAVISGFKAIKYRFYSEDGWHDFYMSFTDDHMFNLTFVAPNIEMLDNNDDIKFILNSLNIKEPNTRKLISFNDVFMNSWYFDSIKYAYENNLIKGYNDTTFAPNDNLTRGMLVTILYRFEGAKANDGKSKFADVDSKQWYAQPIKWASENGVVAGYNDKAFGPEDNITREQLAVILYRYAAYKEKDMNKTNDLKKFSDIGSISDYAVKAMKWAVGTGVITGNANGTLNPKGNATRAETAAMMTKYCKNVGK